MYQKCQYKTGKCAESRALKRNGLYHSLCEDHRIKQNLIQRRSDRKYQSLHAQRRKKRSVQKAAMKQHMSNAIAHEAYHHHHGSVYQKQDPLYPKQQPVPFPKQGESLFSKVNLPPISPTGVQNYWAAAPMNTVPVAPMNTVSASMITAPPPTLSKDSIENKLPMDITPFELDSFDLESTENYEKNTFEFDNVNLWSQHAEPRNAWNDNDLGLLHDFLL